MKKIINEITLKCIDISEVADDHVDSAIKFRNNLDNYKDLTKGIKAEFDLADVTVVDSRVRVEDESDPLNDVTDLLNKMDSIRFDNEMTEMEKIREISKCNVDVIYLVARLEEDNIRLREELNNG